MVESAQVLLHSSPKFLTSRLQDIAAMERAALQTKKWLFSAYSAKRYSMQGSLFIRYSFARYFHGIFPFNLLPYDLPYSKKMSGAALLLLQKVDLLLPHSCRILALFLPHSCPNLVPFLPHSCPILAPFLPLANTCPGDQYIQSRGGQSWGVAYIHHSHTGEGVLHQPQMLYRLFLSTHSPFHPPRFFQYTPILFKSNSSKI